MGGGERQVMVILTYYKIIPPFLFVVSASPAALSSSRFPSVLSGNKKAVKWSDPNPN